MTIFEPQGPKQAVRIPSASALLPTHKLPPAGYGIVEFAALIFLVFPLLPFFVGFTAPYIAVPAVLTIFGVLYRTRPQPISTGLPTWHQGLVCAVTSALFLWACAYLPPFGRSWDWIKHFAIINELARYPWPPVNETTHTFLRYALGYYLVPALIARWLGERLIVPSVFLQTWAGLCVVALLLLQKIRPSRPSLFLIVFLLFGGLDLVGWYFWGLDRTFFSTKEWWTGRHYLFAYEGHATLFLWVPQHALAGMLGMLLLISADGRPAPPKAIGLLGAAVLFWSPLVAMGLLPFALVSAVRSWHEIFADVGNILCGVALIVPLAGYLLAGSAGIPHGFTFSAPGFSIPLYVAFLSLEVGFYLVALRFHGWHHLRYPMLVMTVLVLLPLYRIGIYNDFTMRACIPAVVLLAIAVAETLAEANGNRWLPLAVLVALGMAGSIIEIIGRGNDGSVRVHEVSLRSGFLFEDPAFFVQYNAPLPNWVLRR
jgi:hypothetical protein